MKNNVIYSLYENYFGKLYVYNFKHTGFDKKIKDIASVNLEEKTIKIYDKEYDNKDFIKWINTRHQDTYIKI